MGFRATLNFRKLKVALNPMYRIALNVSLNLSIYYSFRHVLKPGTPEQPKKPGTPNLTVLFCFPNTDHVNVICQCNLFPKENERAESSL